jgi:hypothetical protein
MPGCSAAPRSSLNRSSPRVYCAHAFGDNDKGRTMSFLDIYLIVLFLALVGLLVVKFRG